jgi:hypothetical protein
MESIGKKATDVAAQSRTEDWRRDSVPATLDFVVPPERDQTADVAIPARVVASWIPSSGRRQLRRALHSSERAVLERRASDLRIALAPYARPAQDDRVAAAIAELFGAYRSMRERGDDVVARVDSAMRLLRRFPAWAIETACVTIRRNGYKVAEKGQTRTERHWPPSDPEICGIVESVTASRAAALAGAVDLLDAPISRDVPTPPPAEAAKERVRDSLEAFQQRGETVPTQEQAGRDAARIEAHRKQDEQDRLDEYRRAGVEPPEFKGIVVSLPMMLKQGWVIREIDGKRVLAR